jgi:hypothetical protein
MVEIAGAAAAVVAAAALLRVVEFAAECHGGHPRAAELRRPLLAVF